MLEVIVGGVTAERVLLYLQAYDEAYGREIASTFGLAQSQVQKQLTETRVRGNPGKPYGGPLANLHVESAQSTGALTARPVPVGAGCSAVNRAAEVFPSSTSTQTQR